MKPLIHISVLLLFIFIATFSHNIQAGPTVMRDNRISDIGLTPVLGRGYTIATNTFQSLCMKNVVNTTPSYDFQYKFRSLSGSASTSASASVSERMSGGAMIPLEELGIPLSLGVELEAQASYTYSGGVKMYYHRILVEINMDSYYASVDEAQTDLSESAAALLSNDDVPGFFNSCGTYYVRSLGRNAKFISVFTYLDTSVTADVAFEEQLKAQVSAFDIVKGIEADVAIKSSFSATARLKQLSINAMAIGLGKNEGATLISYDLETFKAAIRDAFISMQKEKTGKVSTMEVIPWVENTKFQQLIKLEKNTIDPATGKTMPLYKKKHNLELNGEYLAEIDRADRNMLNIYYKAKICRQTIDTNWKKDGQFYKGMENSLIVNNKIISEKMKLSELDKILTPEYIDKLLQDENTFMYGSGGAQVCIGKMMEVNMFKKNWREIPECVKLRSKLSAVMGSTIDNYCMPKLAPPKKLPPAPPAELKKTEEAAKKIIPGEKK